MRSGPKNDLDLSKKQARGEITAWSDEKIRLQDARRKKRESSTFHSRMQNTSRIYLCRSSKNPKDVSFLQWPQKHVDRISPKEVFVQCPVRHVHNKFIAIKDVMKLPNVQESQTAVRGSTGEEGEICSFRILHGPLPSQTLRIWRIISKTTRRKVPEGATSKTTVDTDQYSRSKEVLLRTWQEQLSWNFQSCWSGLVKPTTQFSACTQVHMSEAPGLLPTCRRKSAHMCG